MNHVFGSSPYDAAAAEVTFMPEGLSRVSYSHVAG
jgi:hypothetical protein